MFREGDPRPVSKHHDVFDVDTHEYVYEPGNGTSYRGWCVRLTDGRAMVAVAPVRVGERYGGSWYVFHGFDSPDAYLSWDYTYEKLQPARGDMWAIQRLVAHMLGCRFSEAPFGEGGEEFAEEA